jgi:hypothetical protein
MLPLDAVTDMQFGIKKIVTLGIIEVIKRK